MTIYGTKEQTEKFPGFYSSLEKDLEEWNNENELEQSQNPKINSDPNLIRRYLPSMFCF